MRIKLMTCAIAATAALALAACGGDDDDTSTGTTEASGAETTAESGAAAGAAASVVGTGETDLGEVLTNADGLTLYAFTPDEGGTPTCDAECADAWPPLVVDGEELPAGLDASEFSVVERSDGTYQLAANDWPLYTFGGDAAPGDVNGQGVADTWYAVDADGAVLRDAQAGDSGSEAPATTAESGGDTGY